MTIKYQGYLSPGIYLRIENNQEIRLTNEDIESKTRFFWEDSNKLTSKIKQATDFQRCPFCPLKEDSICDAIRPIIPLLEDIDSFLSHQKVLAIYTNQKKLVSMLETTMQQALKHISILSLTTYCQIGKTYQHFYEGVNPLQSGSDIAKQLYRNIFYHYDGDKEKVAKVIKVFREQQSITTNNQLKRLNLICDNDAFLNAFVSTNVANELLLMQS